MTAVSKEGSGRLVAQWCQLTRPLRTRCRHFTVVFIDPHVLPQLLSLLPALPAYLVSLIPFKAQMESALFRLPQMSAMSA